VEPVRQPRLEFCTFRNLANPSIGGALRSFRELWRVSGRQRCHGGTENDAFSTDFNALPSPPHVAGTYDGSTSRIYVNGVLEGSSSVSNALGSTSTHLNIR
jgi:hypothetical protein